MMNRLLAFLFLTLVNFSAFAADYARTGFNYSYVDPGLNRPASCPAVQYISGTYQKLRCNSAPACAGGEGGPGNQTVQDTCRKYNLNLRDWYVTNLCFRPSCYYQAYAYINKGFDVQPLTADTDVIGRIVNNLTASKLAGTTDVYPEFGDPRNICPVINMTATNQQIKNGKQLFTKCYDVRPPEGNIINGSQSKVRVLDGEQTGKTVRPSSGGTPIPAPNVGSRGDPIDIGAAEPGGGTSAIQGLLWSWRMLSNNWKGQWAAQSSYEATAGVTPARANLPDNKNLKNIILISDGLDTDGYSSGMTFPGTGASAYTRLLNESGVGFQFAPAPPKRSLQRENCDAHRSNTPVSQQNYVTLCDKLYEQGIRVHVIHLGAPAPDDKLRYCAERTRGLFFENVSSSTGSSLTNAFKQIFASIMAQNVRLVEK